jgi:alkyldihydroxyacetonephosphate synthase
MEVMRRWNGWGEEDQHYPLPEAARRYLAAQVGQGLALPDASHASVLATVPASRLRPHPSWTLEPQERLLHARGQSLPDWVALRAGRIGTFPDGVAYPADSSEVQALLRLAQQQGMRLIPYGGGTSVAGHINPLPGPEPVLTVDLTRLARLLALDETSRLATVEAGIRGPALEAELRSRGYTLGHFPQSFDYSTLGGWIATRSSGQQSYYYGRIEQLFAGGEVETLHGRWVLPPLPASAAGPDLRHLVLGSEGRFGVITQAVVRVQPVAERESFYGIFFPNWTAGEAAVRALAQSGVQASMLRLSDAVETDVTLALSGQERLVAWAERGLRAFGFGPERCLLLAGVTGSAGRAAHERRALFDAARAWRGLPTGTLIGNVWRKGRFRAPLLRNTLWEHGYALDTLETALPWHGVSTAIQALTRGLRDGLQAEGERVLAFAHVSHVYPDGASLYVTYLFRRASDPDVTLRRWEGLKALASRAVVAHGGTISHQHGVGLDHRAYLAAEKGEIGLAVMEAVRRALDPDERLNPGKLIPAGSARLAPDHP